MESVNHSQAERKDKGNDGRLEWRRKSISQVEIRANSHQQKIIRQSQTTNRINRTPEIRTFQTQSQNLCKLLQCQQMIFIVIPYYIIKTYLNE